MMESRPALETRKPYRILAISCTNTRQTTAALDVLLKSLEERDDLELQRWQLETEVEYPYPWSFFEFFSIFPECVNGTSRELRPPKVDVSGSFDCVVLAYPIWFLAPALPMQAFLESDYAAVLDGTPVISLITCRNMWFNAALETAVRIRALGGRLLDSIVLQDNSPPWATFITTPVWLLTGRRQFWRFPPAGISASDIEGVSRLSEAFSAALDGDFPPPQPMFSELDPISIEERYLWPEMVLKRVVLRPWAWVIASLSSVFPFLEKPLIYLYFFVLLGTIVLMIPFLIVSRIVLVLFFRSRFDALLRAVRTPYS